MEEIGEILPALFKREIRRTEPRLVEILAPLWPRVAGKAIALHSRPIGFEAGTLILAADCSNWSAQLHLLAEEIRAEVNSFLGRPLVRKLRVRKVPELQQLNFPSVGWRRTSAPSKPATIRLPNAAKIDPDISRIVESSCAKYFARSGRQVH